MQPNKEPLTPFLLHGVRGLHLEMVMEIESIYQNFDTLEVSFQCKIPSYVLARLADAKAEAQMARNPAYAQIGSRKLSVMVYETGAKGG